jgi:hypothetical protein
LSRKRDKAPKQSKERKKLNKRVARVHERTKNRRKNVAHQESHKLVKQHGLIAVEALVVRNMIKNPKLSKSQEMPSRSRCANRSSTACSVVIGRASTGIPGKRGRASAGPSVKGDTELLILVWPVARAQPKFDATTGELIQGLNLSGEQSRIAIIINKHIAPDTQCRGKLVCSVAAWRWPSRYGRGLINGLTPPTISLYSLYI